MRLASLAAPPQGMRPLGPVTRTALLGVLAALPPLSIDLNLPALSVIAQTFEREPSQAALTVSGFMAAFGVSQLAYGPASDRWGRRPVLLFGLLLYVVGGFLCTVALSLTGLIAARVIQGAGAGAGMALNRAIVRDIFPDPIEARVQFSRINMLMQLAPIVAPVLGSAVLAVVGDRWRTLFAILTLVGVCLGLAVYRSLPESRQPDPLALRPTRLLASLREFAAAPGCMRHTLLAGLGFGCLFAFVTGSSPVFVTSFGLSSAEYALVFAGVSVCIIAGSQLNVALSGHGVPATLVLRVALLVCFAAGLAGCGALVLSGSARLPAFVLCMAVLAGAYGLVIPNITQAALQPVPHIAGMAAALLGAVQTVSGALAGLAVLALLPVLGPVAMPFVMATAAGVGGLVACFGDRREPAAVFRRP